MVILRLVGFLAVASIAGCFLMFVLRHDRRYLRLASQILRFGVILLAIVMALYVLERLVLVA